MTPASPKRTGELGTGLVRGPPLGIVLVWWLNSYVLPAPMPAEIAVAVGSVVTTAIAAVARLLDRRK